MYTVAQALQYVNARTSNGLEITKSIAGYAVEEHPEEDAIVFDWTEYGPPLIPEEDEKWLTDIRIETDERDFRFWFSEGVVTFLEEREYDQAYVPRPWCPADDETIELED